MRRLLKERDIHKRNHTFTKLPYTLFVIDQQSAIKRLGSPLLHAGFRVRTFSDGDKAFRRALSTPPALFVVGTTSMQDNGVSLCGRIRQISLLCVIPIIIVSPHGDEADRVAALNAGADDYIPTPFGERGLIARVRAVLRRCYELGRPTNTHFDAIHSNTDTVTLTVGHRAVDISLSEFRLLEYFVKNPGRTVDRNHLLRTIRTSSRHINPRVVDVYAKRIRSKIETDETSPKYLRTVRGLGYCFHFPQ